MPTPFKIRACLGGTKMSGAYLGEAQEFSFNNQSSEPKVEFILHKGTVIELEFEAVRTRPEPGDVVDLEGAFYNFTKRTVPELTFVVTSVKVLA